MLSTNDIKAIEKFLEWLNKVPRKEAVEGMELAVYISYMTNANKTVKDVYERFHGKWPFSGRYMYFSHITEDFEFTDFNEEFAYKICTRQEFEDYRYQKAVDRCKELEEEVKQQRALTEAADIQAEYWAEQCKEGQELLNTLLKTKPEGAEHLKLSTTTQGVHWFNKENKIWVGDRWVHVEENPTEWVCIL